MLNGLVWSADLWEMRLETNSVGGTPWTFEGFTSSIFGYGAITTRYTPDYLTAPKGIEMTCSASKGGTEASMATLDVPLLGISESESYTGAGTDEINCRVELENVKVWIEGSGVFRLTADDLHWYVNGVLVFSHGAAIDLTSGMTGIPSSIPLLGIAPYLSANTTVDPVNAAPGGGCLDGTSDYGFGTDGWANVTGGWRFTPVGGTPTALDINLAPTCAFVSGTDTWSVLIESRFTENIGSTLAENLNKAAEVWILPDIDREVLRTESSYEALIYRWGCHDFGYTAGTLTQIYNCANVETTNTNTATPTSVYGPLSEFLQGVGQAEDTIDDLLQFTLHAQVNYADGRTYSTTTVSLGTVNTAASWAKLGAGSPASGLDHPSYFAAFTNQVGNPHWSFAPWFPPDSASSSVRWPLMGSPSSIEYWYGCRQQYMAHPSLPEEEATLRRVNVCTEGITQNGVTSLYNTITGLPCPWGIVRYGVLDQSEWPANFTTNATSADRFLFKDGSEDGTGSVSGSGIELTAGDAIEFELASFEAFPFMAPTLAGEVVLGWSTTNVSNLKVFAVGADGSKVLITDNVEGTFAIPYGLSKRWATSGAADYGQAELTDTYDPIKGSDGSAAVLADIERISSFGLLPGYSPSKLRFEITKTNSANPATIDHIQFIMPDWSTGIVHHETGGIAVLMFPDGPLVRYGCLSFYDYLADAPISVPLVANLGRILTVGDLWAWMNAFVLGQDAQTDMLAYTQAAFVEGEEFTIVDHLWRDPFDQIVTVGLWLQGSSGPQGIYYSSYRACIPPLVQFPTKKASSGSDWLPTGDWAAQAISKISRNHPHIMPIRDGIDPDPELVISASNVLTAGTNVSGWFVGIATEAVANDEGYDWIWTWDSKEWFGFRAWRGQCFVPGEGGALHLLAMTVRADLMHFIAEVDSGSAEVTQRDNALTVKKTMSPVTAEEVCMACFGRAIYLGAIDSGAYKVYKSTGVSYTLAYTVTSSGDPKNPVLVVGSDGTKFHYWLDGSDVKGAIWGGNDAEVEAPFTVVGIGSVDDGGLALAESYGTGADRKTRLVVKQSGSLEAYTSTDGVNFS